MQTEWAEQPRYGSEPASLGLPGVNHILMLTFHEQHQQPMSADNAHSSGLGDGLARTNLLEGMATVETGLKT